MLSNSSNNKNIMPIYEKLRREYQDSIPLKIDKIQSIIEHFQTSDSLETLNELKFEIHKIAGSAGSFGYPLVSNICKEFEKEINQKIKDFPNSTSHDWKAQFQDYLAKIQNSFYKKD